VSDEIPALAFACTGRAFGPICDGLQFAANRLKLRRLRLRRYCRNPSMCCWNGWLQPTKRHGPATGSKATGSNRDGG
jgi:hypothetical protein